MNKSDSIKELATALAKAQSELKPLSKNSENPYFKSHYADLGEAVEKILPVFSKHGLSISQGIMKTDGDIVVVSLLMHSSGEWLSYDWPVVVNKDKPGPQDFASSATYARRYGLMAIACAAAQDDDANAAQGHREAKPSPAQWNKAPIQQAKELKNYASPEELDKARHTPPSQVLPPPGPDTNEDLGFTDEFGAAGDFRITFGKHTGKTIRELGLNQARDYAKWLSGAAEKEGKELSPKVKAFVDQVNSIN